MLAAGLLHLRRLPGVMRPAIAVPIPARQGPSVLLDAGANADARPDHLLQFAHMGSVFSEEILGVRDPEVRLLSIGEEDEKGNQLTLEAHQLLRDDEQPELPGQRREPRPPARRRRRRRHRRLHRQHRSEAPRGDDQGAARRAPGGDRPTATGKLGGALIRPAARRLRTRLDPDTYGGAYLLGLRGLAVIAHGSSGRHGDRERDPPRRTRSRAPGRRKARGAAPRTRRCMIAAFFVPDPETPRQLR